MSEYSEESDLVNIAGVFFHQQAVSTKKECGETKSLHYKMTLTTKRRNVSLKASTLGKMYPCTLPRFTTTNN